MFRQGKTGPSGIPIGFLIFRVTRSEFRFQTQAGTESPKIEESVVKNIEGRNDEGYDRT